MKVAEKIEYQSVGMSNLLDRPLNDIEGIYAPEPIYYKGAIEIPVPPCPRVSVIGTRQPAVARNFSCQISNRDSCRQ